MTIRIAKFVTTDYPWPWLRQTPRGDGVFGNTRFVFDRGCRDYDYLVVFNQVPLDLTEEIDSRRAVFIAAEPTSVKRYDAAFLAQFGTVITTDRETTHPHHIFSQTALPWHIGVPTGQPSRYGESLSYAQLAHLSGRKTKLVSLICSNKDFTPEHRRRLQLVEGLRRHFGKRIDFFGRGFRDIEDKAQALIPYRYHIALENSDSQDFWSEKLADPYLAGTFPIYWGCRNLEDYFPPESFARISVDDLPAAIDTIEAVIASEHDRRARDALAEAKRRVMTEYNIFALLDRTLAGLPTQSCSGSVVHYSLIVPEPVFVDRSRSMMARCKMFVHRLLAPYPRIFNWVRNSYQCLASMVRGRK